MLSLRWRADHKTVSFLQQMQRGQYACERRSPPMHLPGQQAALCPKLCRHRQAQQVRRSPHLGATPLGKHMADGDRLHSEHAAC